MSDTTVRRSIVVTFLNNEECVKEDDATINPKWVGKGSKYPAVGPGRIRGPTLLALQPNAEAALTELQSPQQLTTITTTNSRLCAALL